MLDALFCGREVMSQNQTNNEDAFFLSPSNIQAVRMAYEYVVVGSRFVDEIDPVLGELVVLSVPGDGDTVIIITIKQVAMMTDGKCAWAVPYADVFRYVWDYDQEKVERRVSILTRKDGSATRLLFRSALHNMGFMSALRICLMALPSHDRNK